MSYGARWKSQLPGRFERAVLTPAGVVDAKHVHPDRLAAMEGFGWAMEANDARENPSRGRSRQRPTHRKLDAPNRRSHLQLGPTISIPGGSATGSTLASSFIDVSAPFGSKLSTRIFSKFLRFRLPRAGLSAVFWRSANLVVCEIHLDRLRVRGRARATKPTRT